MIIKKTLLAIFFSTIFLTGCQTTLANNFMGDLYAPKSTVIESIDGNFTVTEVMIAREWNGTIVGNYSVSLKRYTSAGQPDWYRIVSRYEGDSWRFFDSFRLKTNSGVRTIKDRTNRQLISADYLYEELSTTIDKNLAEELIATDALSFQMGATLMILDMEGIIATREFLKDYK